MIADFTGKSVLVTGGTMGIGLSTALVFAARGADCVITYKWGSADESEVISRFTERGLKAPSIFRADAGLQEDTLSLLEAIRKTRSSVDVLVSNVVFAPMVAGPRDYSLRALEVGIQYSAWPLFDYTQKIREVMGAYPKYVVGMSSPGPDEYSMGYDFIGASKAVLETLCRYFTYHLRHEDTRINIIRARAVRTPGFTDAFGSFQAFAKRFMRESDYVEPEEVANVVIALCSGLLDGMKGQVVTVDHGTGFLDNHMHFYNDRERIGL